MEGGEGEGRGQTDIREPTRLEGRERKSEDTRHCRRSTTCEHTSTSSLNCRRVHYRVVSCREIKMVRGNNNERYNERDQFAGVRSRRLSTQQIEITITIVSEISFDQPVQ